MHPDKMKLAFGLCNNSQALSLLDLSCFVGIQVEAKHLCIQRACQCPQSVRDQPKKDISRHSFYEVGMVISVSRSTRTEK